MNSRCLADSIDIRAQSGGVRFGYIARIFYVTHYNSVALSDSFFFKKSGCFCPLKIYSQSPFSLLLLLLFIT